VKTKAILLLISKFSTVNDSALVMQPSHPAFGITSIVLFFRKREHYIRKKALEKNRLIASQLTALKAQMKPHFLFNTLNSLQDLILMKDFQKTNFYLNKYSQLIRKILEI